MYTGWITFTIYSANYQLILTSPEVPTFLVIDISILLLIDTLYTLTSYEGVDSSRKD